MCPTCSTTNSTDRHQMLPKLIIFLLVFIFICQFLYIFLLDILHRYVYQLFSLNSSRKFTIPLHQYTQVEKNQKVASIKSKAPMSKDTQLYFLPNYNAGDVVDNFKLQTKLEILGQKKSYHNDESWSYMLQSPMSSSAMIETSIYYDEFNKSSSQQSLVKLKDTEQQHGKSCFKNQSYCLDKNIFHGGHGEIWRAHKINRLGIVNHDVSYILKRMHVKNREDILHCAHREIYFGNMLADRPNFARFITHFTTDDDYWLVFHDEGYRIAFYSYNLYLFISLIGSVCSL